MKKIYLAVLFVFMTILSYTQVLTKEQLPQFPFGTTLVSITEMLPITKVDTIISTDIYKSYCSFIAKNPLFVVYKLYQGGGEASRVGMVFKNGGYVKGLDESNYAHSGYDIGHMDNAEDNANNKKYEAETFFFYNSLPQTPKSNRGIWKSIETKTRKDSQQDTLLIICGGTSFNIIRFVFNGKNSGIIVPAYTFKVVKNLKTKNVRVYLFKNDNSDEVKEIDLIQLYKILPFSNEIFKLNLL